VSDLELTRVRLLAERDAAVDLLRRAQLVLEQQGQVQPVALRVPLKWHLVATRELCQAHTSILGLPVTYALEMARAVLGEPMEVFHG
jgi:hypothetical protein